MSLEHHVVRAVDNDDTGPQYVLICTRCRRQQPLLDTAIPVLVSLATDHDKEHHDGQPPRPRHQQPG